MNCSRVIQKGKSNRFLYNPFELAICGDSSESRAKLTAKVVSQLSNRFEVAQIIGRQEEYADDSVMQIGVNLIRGSGQHGLLYPEAMDEYLPPRPVLDADLAIVESGEDLPLRKLVWVEDGTPPDFSNVLAYVGRESACPILPASANYFTERQTPELTRFVEDHFDGLAGAVPLYGLVLTGGRSTRMQADKGALEYHGRTQAAHCFELLNRVCDQVYVSLRAEQGEEPAYAGYPQIPDAFLGFGPLGGILSAQKAHPDAAWLVLACDLPYVTSRTLEHLLERRNPFKLATAYVSALDRLPEPLCAVYEPKSIFRLMQFLALGYHCPRKALINSDSQLIEPAEDRALNNVNSPEERQAALRSLATGESSQ